VLGDEHLLRLERWEIALARAALEDPGRLPRDREAALRWAIGLARIRLFDGRDLAGPLERFRGEVSRTLGPAIRDEGVDLDAAALLAPVLAARTAAELERLATHGVDRASLEEEIRQKKLVLALGGGGGSAWVHLGAFSRLEEEGVRPALVAGASMGAVLGLLRARNAVYDQGEVLHAVRSLSFSRIFGSASGEGRYGLPGALRLRLPEDVLPGVEEGLRFSDLPIPLVVTLSGVRKEGLPRPLSFYQRLLPSNLSSRPRIFPRSLKILAEAAAELVRTRSLLPLRVGGADWTAEMDPLDAVGFSCALPGVIQYDVAPTGRRHLFDRLLEAHGVGWLLDGGLTENVPAKAAWTAVQEGTIGSRNALILALDGFSPRLSSGLWMPLQRIAHENVRRSLEYAHAVVTYSRTLSPTDILPSIGGLIRAIDLGRSQLAHQMPLIRKLTSPLPPLPHVASARVRIAV
jgi:predicted acylesterase/phospholipase RssA